jgi:hypothetical protein
MKNIQWLFVITLVITGLSGCGKFTKFNINYSENFTIPASIGLDVPVEIPTPPIQSDIASKTSSNNTNPSLIETIYLKSLKATITSPEGVHSISCNTQIFTSIMKVSNRY